MTKFKEWPDYAIDVLVGGTPCQSYSVAGLRAGLDDPRGNLMLTYVAIARRYRPKFCVWENGPGVLSSNEGRDFGSLLGLLTGQHIEAPPGGWKNSGVVPGHKSAYGVAWRVLDAQYAGVPQRRRRVFVVGYLGDWRRAAGVLFEQHSMSGDSPPSRKTGKGFTRGIEFGPSGGKFTDVNPTLDCRAKDGPIRNQLAGAVITTVGAMSAAGGTSKKHGHGWGQQDWESGYCIPVPFSIMPMNSGKDYKARQTDVAQPIMAGGPTGGNQGGDYVVCPVHTTGDGFWQEGFGTLRAREQDSHENLVVSIQDGRGMDKKQNGKGWDDSGVAYTLDQTGAQAVAIPLQEVGKRTGVSTDDVRAGIGIGADGDPMYTLQAGAQHGGAVAFAENSRHEIRLEGGDGSRCGSLSTGGGKPGQGVPMVFNMRGREGGAMAEMAEMASIRAASGGSSRSYVAGAAVRRLTPRECERLQGFPDDFTLIPIAKGRKVKWSANGPRYKALGNSMATPVVRWIGERIDMVASLDL